MINGNKTTFYRHSIYEFSSTVLNGKEKWTARKFIKNIYDIWTPTHFKRICSIIDKLPSVSVNDRDVEMKGEEEWWRGTMEKIYTLKRPGKSTLAVTERWTVETMKSSQKATGGEGSDGRKIEFLEHNWGAPAPPDLITSRKGFIELQEKVGGWHVTLSGTGQLHTISAEFYISYALVYCIMNATLSSNHKLPTLLRDPERLQITWCLPISWSVSGAKKRGAKTMTKAPSPTVLQVFYSSRSRSAHQFSCNVIFSTSRSSPYERILQLVDRTAPWERIILRL